MSVPYPSDLVYTSEGKEGRNGRKMRNVDTKLAGMTKQENS